ncbi:uncharacterized protein LOC130998155 [Salvia miltiorrhiza]|uniref:uncharacterized protein LOC130998155 n=1 Tax=Salvia miltiorrhiza TaxID=226208 RepID=UPI0025AD7FFD|nr:uncharacterized protein LOC130998155 [Salvia miltiorrhiza]
MEPWKVRSSRSKANNVVACKKHPKHRQSPGVCSICLRQKLSQLSNCDSSRAARSRSASSASSLSSYVSSLSSSNASPAPDAVAFFRKSRSMALVVPRRRKQEAGQNGKEIPIVKGGFWSKLLPQKSTRTLMHSRTTREIKGSLHHFIT